MVENPPADYNAKEASSSRRRIPRWRWMISLGLAVLLLGVWLARYALVGWAIEEQLAALDLPMTYEIESIDPDRQVLTNVVIGDPAYPDLTVERVVVQLEYGFGAPELGKITLVRPRLYGRYDEAGLSFGSLDKLLFAEDSESEGLPALDVTVEDGRALLETLYGPVGAKLDGAGDLSGGFAGMLAVNAPELVVEGCRLDAATAYGELTTRTQAIGFSGPLRLAGADCQEQGFALRNANFETSATIPTDFASAQAKGVLEAGRMVLAGNSVETLAGPLQLGWKQGQLDASLDLEATGVDLAGTAMRVASLDTSLRLRDEYARMEASGDIAGEGVNIDRLLAATLRDNAAAVEGTLLEPLLAKLRAASSQQLGNTFFNASFTARSNEQSSSLVIPELQLRSGGGATLLTASQLQYASGLSGLPHLSGNFRAGGGGLPDMVGRMERQGSGTTKLRLRMDPYTSGTNRLALPDLTVTQAANGNLSFVGLVEAGGALPGGSVQNLRLPVQGQWTGAGGLALWDSCTTVALDRLEYANLVLSDRDLKVCPARGKPIVSMVGGSMRIAAGVPALDLSGTLAGTPVRLSSGPVGFAYPGVAVARDIDVVLGPRDTASRFSLSGLEARFDPGGSVTGSFSDTRIELAAIPLDMTETAGQWSYANGVLAVSDASFRLLDRQEPARFYPLAARDATLQLEDNVITAQAALRHPASDRVITATTIRHNLSTGTGNARLAVESLRFDDRLQPDELTDLALGVVANVEGIVTGSGRIDWDEKDITSAGTFTTESLDLAAVFGPVEGISGTVEFVDLLSLTTAPDQSLSVRSINPGIEVNDGTIGFALRDGQYLGVTGGTWPFMGGTLYLHPVELNLGAVERRRYVLEVKGLDSAVFIETLELGNLAATGVFDGKLPLVFDEDGDGFVEGGVLISRPPGGNLSYVGELTYEDLTPMANYVFEMLRSLDYREMDITIAGPLTGDILSQIRIDGVKQGQSAKRNFITRQLEDVPIQFNVNVNAPFYKLIGSLKAMYDPAYVRDPRDVGLIDDEGHRLRPRASEASVAAQPDAPAPEPSPELPALPLEEPAIQRRESENMP